MGSTSIEGLVAKNIIDVLLVVTSLEDFDAKESVLEGADFVWCGDPVPGVYSAGRCRLCAVR